MKHTIYSIFLIILITWSIRGYAQGYIKTEYLSASELRDDRGNRFGSGDMRVVSGGYSVPLYTKRFDTGQIKAFSASASASYAWMRNRDEAAVLNPDNILNANVNFTFMQPLSRRWSMLAVAGAGVFSSTGEISEKSILANGGAVFIVKLNENMDLGFGAGVTNSYGTPIAMPMLYLSWHPKWAVRFQIELTNTMKVAASMHFGKLKLDLVGIEMDGMSAVRNIEGRSKIYSMVMLKSYLRPSFAFNRHCGIFIEGGGNWVRGISVTDRSLKAFFNTFKGEKNDPYFNPSMRFGAGIDFKF